MTGTLQVARIDGPTRALGPGPRSVLWVHGCPLRCRGCVATEWLTMGGGITMDIAVIADQLLAVPDISGVTCSGGEPFAQSEGVLALLLELRRRRPDLSLMAYTGLTIEHLRRRGTPLQRALLDHLDLLVDGPYVQARHAALRWRASTNQRIHLLTDRHRHDVAESDVSAGLEVQVAADGTIDWIGVPPTPGFRSSLTNALVAHGVVAQSAISYDPTEDAA